jgi:ADP-heptose:LPS heptosyltransferase
VCQTHIAELYEACPCIDKIISFDRKQVITDEAYRNGIIRVLRELGADLLLNSVYSRETLTDIFALDSCAKATVAFEGDLSNMTTEQRQKSNAYYSLLIKSNGEQKNELERYINFLQGIGISTSSLEPVLWVTPEDDDFAERFFKDNHLNPEKTIALFVSGQWNGKFYEHYKTALSQILKDNRMSVLALGTGADSDINQKIIENLGDAVWE